MANEATGNRSEICERHATIDSMTAAAVQRSCRVSPFACRVTKRPVIARSHQLARIHSDSQVWPGVQPCLVRRARSGSALRLAKFLEDGAEVDPETVCGARAVAMLGAECGVDDRVFASGHGFPERETLTFDHAPQLLTEVGRRCRRNGGGVDLFQTKIVGFDDR